MDHRAGIDHSWRLDIRLGTKIQGPLALTVGKAEGMQADGTKVKVSIDKQDDRTSKVSVTVGMMGDSKMGADILVDPSWLAAHLNDPNQRIVDCDRPESWERAHIPGAVPVKEHYFKNPDKALFIMEPDQFAAATWA